MRIKKRKEMFVKSMWKKLYKRTAMCCLLLLASALALTVSAQTISVVRGTVLSQEDGLPIVGASVLAEGSTVGVITDLDGNFVLNGVPESVKKIRVSFVGMKTVSLPIAANMRIVLESESTNIDEVVVVAYGTAKKSTFTGSASVLRADKLEQRPVTDMTSALLGSMSGVTVNSSSGMPGESPTIRIRGHGSISASSDPLIILDGIPFAGSITSLNPSDIESITVLKDAASSALYGARAANGVLMITSKKGRSGKATVNVKFNEGFTARQSSDYKRVGVKDYMELYWEDLYNRYVKDGYTTEAAAQSASNNLMTMLEYNPFLNVAANEVVSTDGVFNPNAKMAWADDTDWEDALEQLGNRTDATISLNGGTDNTDYYISAGIVDEKGYIVGSKFSRYSAKANVNSQVTSWLKLGLQSAANLSEVQGEQSDTRNNISNPFLFARYIGPLYPIHLHDATTGEYITDSSGNKLYDFGAGYDDGTYYSPLRSYSSPYNPAIEVKETQNGYKRKYFNVKGYAEIKFLKDFTFTANASITSNSYLRTKASKVYEEKANTGSASRTNTFTSTYTFNELLGYNKSIKGHNVDVLLGHESYKYEYNYLYASMKGEIMSGNNELSNYTEIDSTPTSYTNRYRTEGYFMRATYDYENRYFASASYRRDGSSRFYKDSRWGNFWSVGAGWSISREKFMEDVSWVDNLKLRLSYGSVGNDDVSGYYPWVASYEPSNNGSEAGYVQSSLGNKKLKWEVSHNFDVGLEFSFLDILSGTFEYFYRQSSNLLFSVPLSLSTGFDSQDKNAGSMYNSGFEFELNAKIFDRPNWKWNVGVNATFLKNRVTELPIDPFMMSNVFRIEEGHSRYDFYLKQWRGVDPATGSCIYVPAEGATDLVTVDGETYTTSLADAAYDYSGSSIPKATGGFSTSVSYKNISLSALFYYQLGGKMYDTTYSNLMTPNYRSYNTLSTGILARWQNPGDITNVPRISDGSDATDLIGEYSTRWLVSSNLLELASITLSYEFPRKLVKKWGLGSLTVYASGDNLFQVTARQGLYPRQYESGYTNNGDTYAPARAFTAGINLSF